MSQASVQVSTHKNSYRNWVGVGLRHPHYQDALRGASSLDFVEIHAENFFASGGMIKELLDEVSEIYPVSLHGTSMGLGSASPIDQQYLKKFKMLVDRLNPAFISDHACFTWASPLGKNVHAGDLLPLEFNLPSLNVLIENVDRVQQLLGRQILVENISSYLSLDNATLSETEFLISLAERTQCGLLVDLNNLLVNAHNQGVRDPLGYAENWVMQIPKGMIKEIHLAGYTPTTFPQLIIDDHSQPVSDECWILYQTCIAHCGSVPTLIEWDNELPSWSAMLAEANKANRFMLSATYEIQG